MRFFRLFLSFFLGEDPLRGTAANQRGGEVNYGLCMDFRRTGWQGSGLDVLLLSLELEHSAIRERTAEADCGSRKRKS